VLRRQRGAGAHSQTRPATPNGMTGRAELLRVYFKPSNSFAARISAAPILRAVSVGMFWSLSTPRTVRHHSTGPWLYCVPSRMISASPARRIPAQRCSRGHLEERERGAALPARLLAVRQDTRDRREAPGTSRSITGSFTRKSLRLRRSECQASPSVLYCGADLRISRTGRAGRSPRFSPRPLRPSRP
jgi:hypothetical protein